MATASRRALIIRLGLLGLLLCTLGAALWWAPELARRVVRTGRGGQRTASVRDHAPVDRAVADALSQAGLRDRLDHSDRDGVITETWRVPQGRQAAALADQIRSSALASGVSEIHISPRDLLDASLRVYAGRQLRYDLLLVPSLPVDTPPPPSANRRERPLVAIIIGGLGRRDAHWLTNSGLPLTLAIQAWTPYALATARDAGLALQEVLVDLDGAAGTDGSQTGGSQTGGSQAGATDPAQARQALPFSTGFLLRETDPERLSALPQAGVVVTTASIAAARPPSLLVLSAWQGRKRRLSDVLARVRYLAATKLHTAVLLESDDPILPGLLSWVRDKAPRRYRVVLASECARPKDVVGLPEQETGASETTSPGARSVSARSSP